MVKVFYARRLMDYMFKSKLCNFDLLFSLTYTMSLLHIFFDFFFNYINEISISFLINTLKNKEKINTINITFVYLNSGESYIISVSNFYCDYLSCDHQMIPVTTQFDTRIEFQKTTFINFIYYYYLLFNKSCDKMF